MRLMPTSAVELGPTAEPPPGYHFAHCRDCALELPASQAPAKQTENCCLASPALRRLEAKIRHSLRETPAATQLVPPFASMAPAQSTFACRRLPPNSGIFASHSSQISYNCVGSNRVATIMRVVAAWTLHCAGANVFFKYPKKSAQNGDLAKAIDRVYSRSRSDREDRVPVSYPLMIGAPMPGISARQIPSICACWTLSYSFVVIAQKAPANR